MISINCGGKYSLEKGNLIWYQFIFKEVKTSENNVRRIILLNRIAVVVVKGNINWKK